VEPQGTATVHVTVSTDLVQFMRPHAFPGT
jgi:hypothetical protein